MGTGVQPVLTVHFGRTSQCDGPRIIAGAISVSWARETRNDADQHTVCPRVSVGQKSWETEASALFGLPEFRHPSHPRLIGH
jgi:hypothetical protein